MSDTNNVLRALYIRHVQMNDQSSEWWLCQANYFAKIGDQEMVDECRTAAESAARSALHFSELALGLKVA